MTNQNRGCKVTLSHRFTARVQDPLHQKCGRANFGRRSGVIIQGRLTFQRSWNRESTDNEAHAIPDLGQVKYV